jgi:4,5-DOPA dioxygenase extradiol
MQISEMKKSNDSNLKMPALFVGHGSPMNAIATNDYTKSLASLGESISTPTAILCISAHWMTKGTFVTCMDKPKTIHDFYGFPEELFKVQYPAPGSLEFSTATAREILDPKIGLDKSDWGLDHGTWSVMRHLYPKASIPIYQLSLDMSKPPEFHFELGVKLRFLRERGVLIVGSGNIVHNLKAIDWNEEAPALEQAIDFDQWVKTKIEDRNFRPLITDFTKIESGRFSVPTPDHYYPLLYILGASVESDKQQIIFEGFQNASISMRSILFG